MSAAGEIRDTADGPSRDEVDAMREAVVIEFGAAHCGHCRAAQPLIAQALERHRAVRHIKVEDGPGRKLGRSFRVKLWPTLVFMREGSEVARLVRPAEAQDIEQALRQIDVTATKGDS
jgi:thioredoxin 1